MQILKMSQIQDFAILLQGSPTLKKFVDFLSIPMHTWHYYTSDATKKKKEDHEVYIWCIIEIAPRIIMYITIHIGAYSSSHGQTTWE